MSSALRIEGRVWTPDDLDALPEDVDWRRFEIVDGALVVSPHASRPHEFAVGGLLIALRASAPNGCVVIGSTMIDLHPSYRVPDVTVLTKEAYGSPDAAVAPAGVLLAVEIESPSSITTDRVTKPAQYASVGVAHYWRVELEPLRLHAYRLADDAYAHVGTWAEGEIAHLDEPFPVDIDVASLLPARP